MLMNFKNGHSPNTNDFYLCKYKGITGKIRYTVLKYSTKDKIYTHEIGFKFKSKILGWVRIREK